jgi:hypothetical protein
MAPLVLCRYKLAYLQLTECSWRDVSTEEGDSTPLLNAKYRKLYDGVLMSTGGFTPKTAAKAIQVHPPHDKPILLNTPASPPLNPPTKRRIFLSTPLMAWYRMATMI